jgi:hypothetical protein
MGDLSPFYKLTRGNPGAIVALSQLMCSGPLTVLHLQMLCKHGIRGPRLHVFFKRVCEFDVKMALECLESFESPEDQKSNDAWLERLEEGGPSEPLTNEDACDMAAQLRLLGLEAFDPDRIMKEWSQWRTSQM